MTCWIRARTFWWSLGGLACLYFVLTCQAADWPQWRGPQRNGISKETGLLKQWPKDGPTLLWQIKDGGDGYSTPAVVGDRLYLLSNKGKNDEFVQAREVKDGKQVWSTKVGKVGPNQGPQYPGSRSTPTIDGEFLYALGSDGDLICAKVKDGAEVWRKNLRSDFGGKPGAWAYAESPLIDGDVLVCTPGGKEATLVALNKKNGEVIWKSAVPGGEQAAYASPIVVEVGSIKQYVQFLQKGIVGVEAKSGKFLWRYDKTAETSPANIPTPVARDGYVYSSTGRAGGGLVKLKAENDAVTAGEVYIKKNLPTSIGGSVLVADHLYGTNNRGFCALSSRPARRNGRPTVSGPAPSALPTACCSFMARTAAWPWSAQTRRSTTRRAGSSCQISRTGASQRPGPTRSSRTAVSICATSVSCGATT